MRRLRVTAAALALAALAALAACGEAEELRLEYVTRLPP